MGRLVSDGSPRWVIAAGLVLTLVGLTLAGVIWFGPVGDAPEEPGMSFAEVSDERGFDYTANNFRQKGNSRAGVYVADVDNDGEPDILATGGDDPVLFENTDGEFAPSDRLPPINATINSALFLDMDRDGWDDILLLPRRGSPIYLANDEGTFRHQDAGLDDVQLAIPVASSAADYNGDGCLDVFIAQNGNWRETIPEKELLAQEEEGFTRISDPEVAADRRDESGTDGLSHVPAPSQWAPQQDNGNPNFLLEGDCESGTFTDVTEEVGIAGNRWSMAVSFADFTGNGYPDIHEANDFNYDFLWVNQNGTGFERQLIPETNRHAMSSEAADFNRDGQLDIFVTNIRVEGKTAGKRGLVMLDNSGNNLLINDNGSFTSDEDRFNVRDGEWGWAAAATDFENDGQFDLIHTTLHEGDVSRVKMTPPQAWIREGEAFTEVNATELGFDRMSGRGVATLDYNGDGREDIVMSTLGDSFKLYENQAADGGWLQLDVRDADGAIALGADATVRFDDGETSRAHHLQITSRTDLLGQSSRVHHLGVGDASSVTIEVTYRDGTSAVFEDVATDQRVTVYPDGTIRTGSLDGEPAADG